MDNINCLRLYLKYKKYEIPCKFKGLFEVNENIYKKLLFGTNHEYYVKSNVSDDVFSKFLDFWINEKEPKILFEDFYQFQQLSDEFDIMREIVNKSRSNFDECELNLYNLKFTNDDNKEKIEQKISENLDMYIERHGEKLMSLNIQTLYNIFKQSNKNFKKHNEAYELIKNHYIKNKDQNIFVLVSILEGEKLTYENFKDSIYESKQRFGFVPNNELTFFDHFSKEIVKSNEQQFNELKKIQMKQKEDFENQINEIQKKQKQQIDEFKKVQQQQAKQISELIKEVNEIKEKNQKQQQEFNKIIDENKIVYKKQQEENDLLRKKIIEIEKNLNDIKLKQEEEQKRKTQQIELQQKQNDNINKKIDEIESKIRQKIKIHTNGITSQVAKKNIPYTKDKNFNGIINYLQNNSQSILDEIEITSSSIMNNDKEFSPLNVIRYNDNNVEFCSKREESSWICFYFKKHKIIPKNYTIESNNDIVNSFHPRTWVIEGSNNNIKWEIIDEEKDCSFLNGPNIVYTFSISNSLNQEYQYLRMRRTGNDWNNDQLLNFKHFEFFGSIV